MTLHPLGVYWFYLEVKSLMSYLSLAEAILLNG